MLLWHLGAAHLCPLERALSASASNNKSMVAHVRLFWQRRLSIDSTYSAEEEALQRALTESQKQVRSSRWHLARSRGAQRDIECRRFLHVSFFDFQVLSEFIAGRADKLIKSVIPLQGWQHQRFHRQQTVYVMLKLNSSSVSVLVDLFFILCPIG